MRPDRISSEIVRLPRLGKLNVAADMFDNLSKIFYPHYKHRQNSIHYEEPKRHCAQPRSKSLANLEASADIDPERLMIEEIEHAKIIEGKMDPHYQRRRIRKVHSSSKGPTAELIKPIQDILVDRRMTPRVESRRKARMSGIPAKLRAANQQTRKFKEESLKAALTVEKPKVETIESRLRSIVQDIFPLTSQIALGQFIEKFDQMRSLVKTTRNEEKLLDKMIKSEKQTPARKLEILKEKKRKMEADLQSEYDGLLKKHFRSPQGSKESEDAFKRKFRRHLRTLSKTLLLNS